jgi:pyruvate dehydrogenase E1 component alpha subunit
MTTVVTLEVPYTRYLDAEGKLVAPLPPFAEDTAALIELYRAMVFTRRFDAKGVALQRTGRMGTFPNTLGQEAIPVAIGHAMAPEDVFAPTYREQAAQFMRGVTPEEMFLFYSGDERGNDFAEARHDLPVCIPLAAQTLHAAGAATAIKLKGGGRAVVCILGDGATSKGDFYEALNVSGVWELPIVFVIINNQWAISMPRDKQTKAETLAQKGFAAGIAGEQVDGNDVIAVRHVLAERLAKARGGGGPSVIEALTYRLSDHNTADDASRYRDPDEVSAHWKEDPVARLRTYLAGIEAWNKEDEHGMIEDCNTKIDAAVEAYEAIPPQPAEAMFDYLYAELPAALEEQREAVIAAAGRNE